MIKLTELLRFDNLSNVRIRLVPQNRYFDPVDLVQSGKADGSDILELQET